MNNSINWKRVMYISMAILVFLLAYQGFCYEPKAEANVTTRSKIAHPLYRTKVHTHPCDKLFEKICAVVKPKVCQYLRDHARRAKDRGGYTSIETEFCNKCLEANDAYERFLRTLRRIFGN